MPGCFVNESGPGIAVDKGTCGGVDPGCPSPSGRYFLPLVKGALGGVTEQVTA